jgi:DNA-binding HxlR family transcriptional regulator
MGEAYEPRSGCPIDATIEMFGDLWSLFVLRDVVFGDRRYFRELRAGSEEGIASNIPADRLKRLVAVGLLTREDARAGQRARYSLTEPAIQVVLVFAQLGSWDFATGPPAASCAFAPSCSNKADPRSGRSSWTNCATRTSAPIPHRDHPAFANA